MTIATILLCLIPTQTPITTQAEFHACECRIEVTAEEPHRYLSSQWGRSCPANIRSGAMTPTASTQPVPEVPGGSDGGGEVVPPPKKDDPEPPGHKDVDRDKATYDAWRERQ
jgi:hypothetical protein